MNLDPIRSFEGVRIVETFFHAGFKCEVVRIVNGGRDHHCGYVFVEKDSPLYGLDFMDIPVTVHGGLTFSEGEGAGWLYGFDCNHSGDGCREGEPGWKDAIYARAETVSMVEQFAELLKTASEPWTQLAKTFDLNPFTVRPEVKAALIRTAEVLDAYSDRYSL